jgi:O-antigen biosynthesis protein WbqV
VRPIRLEDLLGRPQAAPDRAAMRALVSGRRVCVTGAGGTIGAELVRQIADDGPAHLTLIDNSEYNLYRIDLELDEAHRGLSRSTVLGDVRDPGRLASTFARERPELVFHAAALKHVHMVEANPNEGVLTNAVGTRNVADACLAAGSRAMVLVSTDKAVNPTSVMGATKRIAESYCQALAASPAAGSLRLVTVRFGNVIGSSGSVVPLFQRQIAAGGPLTVTDPEVARYFMTTREAVQLLLQASALGAGEGGGGIYVLDMGRPIRIVDLARQMIRLAGLTPDKDIEIVFTGLRPGEKKDEALFHPAEPLVATDTPGILRAQSRSADLALMQRRLDLLQAAARDRRSADALSLVAAMVPEYEPSDGAHAAPPADAGLAL